MPIIPSPLRRGFEALLEPFARSLIAARVHPNAITTVGTFILVAGGVAFGLGYARAGGGLLLLSGAVDMVDGKVARDGGLVSRFGAFYDSTLDRIGEVALYTGIALSFLSGGIGREWVALTVGTTILALGASITVSYARARAEGLGLDCKVGIATRAERILGLGVPTVLLGAGPNGYLLFAIVVLLGLTAVITVGQRIVHVYRTTRVSETAAKPRAAPPAMVDVLGKGRSSG